MSQGQEVYFGQKELSGNTVDGSGSVEKDGEQSYDTSGNGIERNVMNVYHRTQSPPGSNCSDECNCSTCQKYRNWESEYKEIEQALATAWIQRVKDISNPRAKSFKEHVELPFSRVKRIMKANEDVRMVSAETSLTMTKACEFFVEELAKRCWVSTVKNKRNTILQVDTDLTIKRCEKFDFLIDVIDGTIENERKKQRKAEKTVPEAQVQSNIKSEESFS